MRELTIATGEWKELGTGTYRSIDYSDQRYDPSDNDQAYGSLGVRYWPSGASSLGTSVRHSPSRAVRHVAGLIETITKELVSSGQWPLVD